MSHTGATARLAALALLLGAGGAAGADPEPQGAWEQKAEALKAEIQGLLLLRELALDEPVARQVLALAWHARRLTLDHEEAVKAVLPAFEKACREFREQDHANKGFAPDLEARVFALERRLIEGRKRYCEAVNALEAKAAALLTPAQRETIDRFPEPGDLAGLLRRVEGRKVEKRLPKPLEAELQRVRAIPAEAWARDRDAILDDWIRRHERLNRLALEPADRAAFRERLGALFEDVRKMAEEEFAASGGKILERLRPPDRLAELREEDVEVHKEVYGGLGRIGKFLCAPCAIPLLEKRLGLKPGEGKPEGLETPDKPK